jgi:Kef-type K+ transport system membrane component KefB
VVTAGLPFLFLGMAARHPAVGVLSDEMLAHLAPVMRISLGLIGFVVGFRLDARALVGVDERTVASAALFSSLPFAGVFLAASALLAGGTGALSTSLADPVFLRDALVLGTAASMTAATAPALLARRSAPGAVERASRIVRLEEVAGIAGLALVAAYFRPVGDAVTWRLPGMAWLMLTVGAGALLGFLIFALVRRGDGPAEFGVLALGSVAFAAGLASYLYLSSVVVCFVAGVLLVNFPGAHQERLRLALARMERPIYLLLLVMLGALWPMRSGLGWLLIPVFACGRLAARALAARVAHRAQLLDLGPEERRNLAIAPVGSLAIAIVVNAQLLYPSESIRDATVAVVGGALLTEAIVQTIRRRGSGSPAPTPAPDLEQA